MSPIDLCPIPTETDRYNTPGPVLIGPAANPRLMPIKLSSANPTLTAYKPRLDSASLYDEHLPISQLMSI